MIHVNFKAGKQEVSDGLLLEDSDRKKEEPRPTESDSVSVASNGEALNTSLDLNVTKSSNGKTNTGNTLKKGMHEYWAQQATDSIYPWD
mmetsp:Transcript_5904/g.9594  ORF Transcript_5904/g.9594 Transcript_5904/m.9594 type:complete len:89 (+) Transcript_5904:2112-2378(+)